MGWKKEGYNMDLKELQLEQLHAMQRKLDSFVDLFENDKVVILDGRLTNEIITGNKAERPTNELYINIEYIKTPTVNRSE